LLTLPLLLPDLPAFGYLIWRDPKERVQEQKEHVYRRQLFVSRCLYVWIEEMSSAVGAKPFEQGVSDDEGTFSFIEEVELDEFLFHAVQANQAQGACCHTARKRKQHLWNNEYWSALVVRQVNRTAESGNQLAAYFGCYAGVDSTSLSISQSVDYRKPYFELLDREGKVVVQNLDEVNTSEPFTIRGGLTSRQDNGNSTAFLLSTCMANLVQAVDGDDGAAAAAGEGQQQQQQRPFFRVRVILRTAFKTATVPISWDSKKETDMVGLENLGATCYLNALLQMLYHINAFRDAVFKIPHQGEIFKSSTTMALQSVFKHLQLDSTRTGVETKDLTNAFGWTSAEAYMQQDAQEMLRKLLEKIEEKMVGSSVEGTVGNLFGGKWRNYISCLNVSYTSAREEEFMDVQLDVKGCKDLYESFSKYTEKEKLEGENKYDAGPEFGKQDAEKGVIFTKFPPVLTILLKRFDFDMQRMAYVKIHDEFAFPARLCLDEFIAQDVREQQEKEEAEQGIKKVSNTYLLHSVLVHSGDVGGGHYYAYIRPSSSFQHLSAAAAAAAAASGEGQGGEAGGREDDGHRGADQSFSVRPTFQEGRGGEWFKFNDEKVSRVTPKEAINYHYGRSTGGINTSFASAYMLVYIRETEAAKLMEDRKAEEIPQDLTLRLDAEFQERQREKVLAFRQHHYTQVRFALESDLVQFRSYNEQSDLIDVSLLPVLTVFNGGLVTASLLAIAIHLNVMPNRIRLWPFIFHKEGKGTFRMALAPIFKPAQALNMPTLLSHLDHTSSIFFVELLPEREEHDQVSASQYSQLLQSETSAMNILRELVVKYLDGMDDPSYDPIQNGNSLSTYKLCTKLAEKIKVEGEDLVKFEGLKKELDRLFKEWKAFLSDVYDEGGDYKERNRKESCVVKIFDPLNLIPLPSAPFSRLDESLQECPIPLKYLTFHPLPLSAKLDQILDFVVCELAKFRRKQHPGIEFDDNEPYELWQTKNLNITLSRDLGIGSLKTFPRSCLTEDGKQSGYDYSQATFQSISSAFTNSSSRWGQQSVLIVQVGASLCESFRRRLYAIPYIISPDKSPVSQWIQYVTHRVLVTFAPIDTPDERIIASCQKQRGVTLMAQSSSSVAAEALRARGDESEAMSVVIKEDGDELSTAQSASKRKRPDDMEPANPASAAFVDSSISTTQALPDPADTTSASSSLPLPSPISSSSAALDMSGTTLKLEVSMQDTGVKIAEFLQNKLGISMGHFQLYPTWQRNATSLPKASPLYPPKPLSQPAPSKATALLNQKDILDKKLLHFWSNGDHKLLYWSSTPLTIYYRVLPLSCFEYSSLPLLECDLHRTPRDAGFDLVEGSSFHTEMVKIRELQTSYAEAEDSDAVEDHKALPVEKGNVLVDRRDKHRLMEVHILDNRVKLWRRQFLKHHAALAGGIGGSGGDGAMVVASEEETGIESSIAEKADKKRRISPSSSSSSVGKDLDDDEEGGTAIGNEDYEWPSLDPMRQETELSNFLLLEDKVFLTCSRQEKVGDLMQKLRRAIGLPEHLNRPRTPLFASSSSSSESETLAHENTNTIAQMHVDTEAADAHTDTQVEMEARADSASEQALSLPPQPIPHVVPKHCLISDFSRSQSLLLENGGDGTSLVVQAASDKENANGPQAASQKCVAQLSAGGMVFASSTAKVEGTTYSSTQAQAPYEEYPLMPLVLFRIDRKRQLTVLNPTLSLADPFFPATFPDAFYNTLDQQENIHLGVQSLTEQEAMFMRAEGMGAGGRPSSMICIVHSFIRFGDVAAPTDLDKYSKPFLTYVLIDDTYETLCERLGLMTGETGYTEYKLAVISGRKPFYIPKEEKVEAEGEGRGGEGGEGGGGAGGAVTGADAGDAVMDVSSSSSILSVDTSSTSATTTSSNHTQAAKMKSTCVWPFFQDKFPLFAQAGGLDRAIQLSKPTSVNSSQQLQSLASKIVDEVAFPTLGIQRSASTSQAKRFNTLQSTGIKIQ